MEKLLEQLPVAALVLLVMGLFQLLKFLFTDKWESSKAEMSKRDIALQQNTLALTELRVELKNLKDLFLSINGKQTKLEGDVNALHKLRREAPQKG